MEWTSTDHCTLAPGDLITLVHFSAKEVMKLLKSALHGRASIEGDDDDDRSGSVLWPSTAIYAIG
jgi:hypothetical protein